VRLEAARLAAEREEEARREARLRAIGHQLDEEAAQRDATASRSTLPLSLSTARRARLWGRSDANEQLVKYAEAWARKIQLNTSVDTTRELAKRPHTDPMVTVALRSDGSVESVTIVHSSGVAEIDEAIRHIVRSQAPYQAFPPELARDFDVVEVRRTWYFDVAIRLY
jgi:TonB family protein